MTTYMEIFREDNHRENLKVENYRFKRVYNFKLLDVTINNTDNKHGEIRVRIPTVNKFNYGLANIFKSKSVSFKSKTTLYHIIIPVFCTHARYS